MVSTKNKHWVGHLVAVVHYCATHCDDGSEKRWHHFQAPVCFDSWGELEGNATMPQSLRQSWIKAEKILRSPRMPWVHVAHCSANVRKNQVQKRALNTENGEQCSACCRISCGRRISAHLERLRCRLVVRMMLQTMRRRSSTLRFTRISWQVRRFVQRNELR
jgi:hypothetical protein